MAKRCPFWTEYTKTREVCAAPAGGAPVWGALANAPEDEWKIIVGGAWTLDTNPWSWPASGGFTPGVSTDVWAVLINPDLFPENNTRFSIQALVAGVTDGSTLSWAATLLGGTPRTFEVVPPGGTVAESTLRFGSLNPEPYTGTTLVSHYTITPSLGGAELAPLTIHLKSIFGGVG